jgi:hypothetical protein
VGGQPGVKWSGNIGHKALNYLKNKTNRNKLFGQNENYLASHIPNVARIFL